MTAQPISRREAWAAEGIFPNNCPIRKILDHVAAKWTTLVLLELFEKPRRFNELGRLLPDISKRMLTQTLRELERDGIVNRQVFDTTPPSVEYSLTPLGGTLIPPLLGLVDWAKNNQHTIDAAQTAYDAR